MSINFIYDKLLDFRVGHEYYRSGYSSDFMIQPTRCCAQLLRNYGLRFKPTADGFEIYYRGTKDGNVITPEILMSEIPDGEKFDFAVYLRNPLFLNFTHVGNKKLERALFRWHNQITTLDSGDNRLTLKQKHYELRPEKFLLEFEPKTDGLTAVRFEIREYTDLPADDIVDVFLTRNPAEPFRYQVDLEACREARYRFRANGGDEYKKNFFLSSELATNKPFGILELHKNAEFTAFTQGNPIHYKIQWNSRRVNKWNYVIIRKHASSGSFTMTEDTDLVAGDANNRYNSIPFVFSAPATPSANSGFRDLGDTVWLIEATTTATSDNKIPLFEEVKHQLALQKDSADYLGDLPNPSVRYANPDVFIYV